MLHPCTIVYSTQCLCIFVYVYLYMYTYVYLRMYTNVYISDAKKHLMLTSNLDKINHVKHFQQQLHINKCMYAVVTASYRV